MKPKEQNKPKSKTSKSNRKDYPLAAIRSYTDLLYFVKNLEDDLFYSEGKNSPKYKEVKDGLNFITNNKDKIEITVTTNSNNYNPNIVLLYPNLYTASSSAESDLVKVKLIEGDSSFRGMIGYSIPRFMGINNLTLLHSCDKLFASDGSQFSRYILKLEFNNKCKQLQNTPLTGYRLNNTKTSNFQFILDHYLMMMERSPEGWKMESYPDWVKTHIEMYQNQLLLQ